MRTRFKLATWLSCFCALTLIPASFPLAAACDFCGGEEGEEVVAAEEEEEEVVVTGEEESTDCKLTNFRLICPDARGVFYLNGDTGSARFIFQGRQRHKTLKYERCVRINGHKCAVYSTDSPAGEFPLRLRSFCFQVTPNSNHKHPVYWSWQRDGILAAPFCNANRYRVEAESDEEGESEEEPESTTDEGESEEDAEEAPLNCTADLRARIVSGGVRVRGSVDCGVECDVDVRLTDDDPRAEFKCTASRLRTIVRLTLRSNNCVKIEGKACVKVFGRWECSGWNSLGTVCP